MIFSHFNYEPSGEVASEYHYLNSKLHRTDGPAFIEYWPSYSNYPQLEKMVEIEEWYLNGLRHRTNGPARIKRYKTGVISSQKWYLHDKEIFPYEWLKENRYRWPLNKEKEIELLLMFG